jgi:hypothetical protein
VDRDATAGNASAIAGHPPATQGNKRQESPRKGSTMTLRSIAICLIFVCAAQPLPGGPPTTAPAPQDDTPILDRVVPDVRFDNVPLEDAIQTIRERTRSNIVIRWDGLHNAGVEKTFQVKLHLWNIPVREAIAVLIASAADGRAEIEYSVEGTILVVSSTRFDAMTPSYDVKVFDVRDLLDLAIARHTEVEKASAAPVEAQSVAQIEERAASDLIELISSVVDPKSFDRDSNGSLHIWAGRLFVSQSPAVQKHVEEFLAKIRKTQR